MNETDDKEQFNQLRLKKMDGRLSSEEQVELDRMMQARLDEAAVLDAEVIGRLHEKEEAQKAQLQAYQAESEQLAALSHLQTQLIADARRWVAEFDRRHEQIQQTYSALTGEPLLVA